MRQDAVLLDERSAEEFFLFLKEKSRTAGTIENYRHSLEELYDYLPEADGGSGKIHRQRDAGTTGGAICCGRATPCGRSTPGCRPSTSFWNTATGGTFRWRPCRWNRTEFSRSCPGRNICGF